MQEQYLKGCVNNMDINHYEIVLTEMAEADLDSIYEYIANTLKEEKAGLRLMEKIETSILRLEQFPYSCEEVHIKPRNKLYRKLVIGKYVVLYRVEEQYKQVVIFHILNKKKDYLK